MSNKTSSAIYHEKQVRELCALHALNNLFQCKNTFEKSELDRICVELSPDHWINPHRSLLGSGNYDINVIMRALQSKDCELVWFDRRKDPSCLDFKNIIGLIFNIPSEYKIGLISIPIGRRHWVTIKEIDGIFYNLDSKLEAPKAVGSETELLSFIRSELSESDKQLFVVVLREVDEDKSWLRDIESYSNNDWINITERDAEEVQLKDIKPANGS
ncbi:hypothetical protein WA026_022155 [Henosepilachna vigintioctopunctata]|uniref:Josephin-2 n=1 Tax=Henosepilachna vigintioctopunctata TaxID=420089 RepID=A0AAW1TZN6_9CUCU